MKKYNSTQKKKIKKGGDQVMSGFEAFTERAK